MAKDENKLDQAQMALVVWLGLAAFITVLLLLSYYFNQKNKKKKEKKTAIQPAAAPVPNDGPVRRRRGMRATRQRNDDSDYDEDDEDTDMFVDKDGKKMGKKKMQKMEMKAEKKAAREAEIEEREERKEREKQLAVEREKEEEKRKEREAEEAELERQRKEEQERKEYEEYLKLKADFSIEESGEVGIITEEESQQLLQQFIDYVKATKVILLEDLASHFNLKVQEVIDRLEHLQECGRLTGVMDDRGKFIYISQEELENVAKFIRRQGRISIADLAESSNTLIKMQGVESKLETIPSVQETTA